MLGMILAVAIQAVVNFNGEEPKIPVLKSRICFAHTSKPAGSQNSNHHVSLAQHRRAAPTSSAYHTLIRRLLAQSPQFYKPFEIAGGRKRVFSVGPVFRAEDSNTPRHMRQFAGRDLEMGIQKDYKEVLMLEGVLLHIFRGIKEHRADEIELIRSTYPSEKILLPESEKEVCPTFAKAQQLLREEGQPQFHDVRDDEDVTTPQEKALGVVVRAKFNIDFYVIDKFPETARYFYANIATTNNTAEGSARVTNTFDFLLREQEILSGA